MRSPRSFSPHIAPRSHSPCTFFVVFISIFAAAAVVTALAASVVRAQWPTTCVDLNDQSEGGSWQLSETSGSTSVSSAIKPKPPVVGDHLGRCPNETFWWAIPASVVPPPPPIPIPLAIHGVGPNVSEYRLIGPGRYLATTSWANNGGSTEATFLFRSGSLPSVSKRHRREPCRSKRETSFGCTGSVRSPVTVARATNVYVSVLPLLGYSVLVRDIRQAGLIRCEIVFAVQSVQSVRNNFASQG